MRYCRIAVLSAVIFSAVSSCNAAGLVFSKVKGDEQGGAVLSFGNEGGFDSDWVSCPTVYYDGRTYKMWYSSFFDSKSAPGGLGLATSIDGVHWKRENGGKPVLTVAGGDEFDSGQAMGPEVLFDGAIYRMWYTGMSKLWHESGFGFYRIGLAISKDGIVWQKANDGKPVLDIGTQGSFDAVQAATPSIIKDAGNYRMWYAAWSPDADKNHRICCAVSADGLSWTKQNDGRPVKGLNPEFAYAPAVVKNADSYILFYMAIKAPKGIFAASSSDGVHWTMMNEGNSVVTPGGGGDFDSLIVGHPFAMVQGGKIRLWYTGYRTENKKLRLSIGLAESPLP